MIALDETFFVGASVITFIALLWKPLTKAIGQGLDGRSAAIQAELDEAVKLKEEAQSLLISYQKQQAESKEEALRIVERAKEEIAKARKQATADLQDAITRRTEIAIKKIDSQQAAMTNRIKHQAIEETIAVMHFLIKDQITDKHSATLVDKAISTLKEEISQ